MKITCTLGTLYNALFTMYTKLYSVMYTLYGLRALSIFVVWSDRLSVHGKPLTDTIPTMTHCTLIQYTKCGPENKRGPLIVGI